MNCSQFALEPVTNVNSHLPQISRAYHFVRPIWEIFVLMIFAEIAIDNHRFIEGDDKQKEKYLRETNEAERIR